MKVIITGVKSSAKSTIGPIVAKILRLPFVDLDNVVVRLYREAGGADTACADIFRLVGESTFRVLENAAVLKALAEGPCVIATGGSSLLNPSVFERLMKDAVSVFLDAAPSFLWERIRKGPLPVYLEGKPDPWAAFEQRAELIRETVKPYCSLAENVEGRSPDEVAADIAAGIHQIKHGGISTFHRSHINGGDIR